jgi:N-succinyldiaminopimelate aminotransferase
MARFPSPSGTAATLSDAVYTSLAARARAHAGPVYALQVGDTWLEPPEVARAALRSASEEPRVHTYSPVQGEPALLDAIQARLLARHRERVEREDVQVMLGATAGLAVVVDALLDPGDEVIVLAPYWPLIRGMIASRGAVPVEVPFHDRVGLPGFDPEAAVARAVTSRTAAIYLNTPNNPTGRVLPRDVVDALARLARRHGLWVLADEVYEDLAYVEAGPAVWTHPELRERTVAVHSVSKAYALAGARVGYVHGPRAVMRAIRGVQTFKTYCAARVFQLAAARAIAEGDAFLAKARETYAEAGRRAAAALGVRAPQAGSFVFVDAAPFFRRGEGLGGFLERCLDEAGILLTPGAAAGADYPTFVRLCFTVVPPAELDAALAGLRRVIGR